MAFRRGDVVEICSKEEGFQGSYYVANILSRLKHNTYLIQFTTLLNDDETRLLRDIVDGDTIRPCPPEIRTSTFSKGDIVDAYANDGWWVGTVIGQQGLMYNVHFESTDEDISYPFYRLRLHKQWVLGNWVDSHYGASSSRQL